jgi:pyruvate carboxylase
MPGGQFTNLKAQAASLGLMDRWHEVCDAYAAANQLFGDIVKVTPSSKVVGDMALFMVTNNLRAEDVVAPGRKLAFPKSVVEMMQGLLGQPEEGWPKVVQKVILSSAGAEAMKGRPGAKLAKADFAAVRKELAGRLHREASEEEVLSHLLYPQVFADYEKHVAKFGDTSVLPTPNFFYGMQPGEEVSAEIEEGKVLVIKFLTFSDVHDDGTRTVFFELNGQPRSVRVADHKVEGQLHKHPKADRDNPNHVAAPMPGKVTNVAVKKGEAVKAGQRLLSIEAMKMETAIYCPRDATVAEIDVKAGSTVEAQDLLLVLEGQEPVPVLKK